MEKKYTKKEEKIISFKQSQFYTVLIFLAFALGILVGYFIWGTNPPVATAPEAEIEQTMPESESEKTTPRYEIPIEGYPSIGPENAPIVLVEFSDFGCSFCAKWHNETFDDLMSAYPDQILFVYRDVPFRAFPASEAVMCAREQNSFWEYHDKLFSYEYGLDENAFMQYAKDLNLDIDKFSTCLSTHRYQENIQRDLEFATDLGVSSTPTFFVNGIPLIGAQPIEAFKQLIDRELAGKTP